MERNSAETPRWTHVPRLVVFDLDYTLWGPYIDVLSGGPFTKTKDIGTVKDCCGEELSLLPEVPAVLNELLTNPQFIGATKIAIASRTGEIEAAKECMGLLEVTITSSTKEEDRTLKSIASYVEIYPCCKVAHFEKFLRQSGVPYEDMLFFDDEYRNVLDVQKLGVTCQYCRDGVTWDAWVQGMQAFQHAKSK